MTSRNSTSKKKKVVTEGQKTKKRINKEGYPQQTKKKKRKTATNNSETRKKNLSEKNKQRNRRKESISKKGTIYKKKRKAVNPAVAKLISFIFDLVFFILIILMLAGAAIFTMSDQQDKSFYGYRFYEVLTNSMTKTKKGQTGNFVAGDMVIVKVKKPKDVKVGDIVTFLPNKDAPDTYLSHRVIEKYDTIDEIGIDPDRTWDKDKDFPVFVTQGDANNAADPPFPGDRIIGVVEFNLPKFGSGIKFIRGNLIPVLVFIICFFLLIIVIRQYFAPEEDSEKSTQKKKKRK